MMTGLLEDGTLDIREKQINDIREMFRDYFK